jgi:hypothetical protein
MMGVGDEPHGSVEHPLGVEYPPVQYVSLDQPTTGAGDNRRKKPSSPAGIPILSSPLVDADKRSFAQSWGQVIVLVVNFGCRERPEHER